MRPIEPRFPLKPLALFLLGAFAVGAPIMDPGDLEAVFAYQQKERYHYGTWALQATYLTNEPPDKNGPNIMQRSGRRRLYDHNLLLRALFAGRLAHGVDGDLALVFSNALFVDIGSAILNGNGAPTCRDLYEDPGVAPFLKNLIATDINVPGAMYVEQYFKSNTNLPFPVRVVPLEINTESDWDGFVKDRVAPLILRSANSGPDLFYLRETLTNHFRSLIAYGGARPLLYLFGKYVLYKPPHLATFEALGVVDYDIGFAHRDPMWIFVDWKKRTLAEAFKPRSDRLRFHAPKTGVEAALAPKYGALRQAAADLRERSRIFLRAIRWQRQVEVNVGAWEQEVARRHAEVLGRAAILFEKEKGVPPADLAGLVDFASNLSAVDGRIVARLIWDPVARKVGVRP